MPSAPVVAGQAQRTAPRAAAQLPDPAGDVALAWPEVVGDDAAANSQPVRVSQGRLIVATSSSVWAQTLQFMEETIKSRLNERLAGWSVERIRFRHAGWEERPRQVGSVASEPVAAQAPHRPARRPDRRAGACDDTLVLSSEQREALEAVQRLGLDPLLKERIVRAMRAAFVRSQQDSVR